MPYKDREVRLAYHKNYQAKKQEKVNEEHAARGPQTPVSLVWPREKLTEGQAMWVAAVIDCDGCLTMASFYNKQRGGYNFSSFAQCSMTRKEVLERLLQYCGGRINKLAYRYKTPSNQKDVWTWGISPNGLRWLLPQIEPYLLIKKRQAQLLLEFLTICKRGVRKRSFYNQRAQAIRAEMARLNFRGRLPGHGALSEPLEPFKPEPMPPDGAWQQLPLMPEIAENTNGYSANPLNLGNLPEGQRP